MNKKLIITMIAIACTVSIIIAIVLRIALKKNDNTSKNPNTTEEKTQEELKKELKENGNAEERLNKAILAVQETSDRMKELARAESQMIIEDAKRNANSIIHEALVNAEKTEYQANCLRKNITVYKNRVKSILESQIEIAEDLDKIEI